MTIENNEEQEAEVIDTPTEVEENVEGESQETPPEEGEAIDAEAKTKEEARANFHARQNNRKEENLQLQRENEYLRQLVNPPKAEQPQQRRQAPNDGILLENFESEDAWIEAKLDARDERRVAQNNVRAKSQSYQQKINEFAKVNKDIYAYEDEAVKVIGGSQVVAQAIMESEKAALIVEAIALDPKKATAINNARDHYSLAKSILALESAVGEKPTFSDAPPPVKISKGEPVVSTKVNLANLSKAKYAAHRNKQRNR